MRHNQIDPGSPAGPDGTEKNALASFPDRVEAGRVLADRLRPLVAPPAVVAAIPRGGVAVALPIVERLQLPLTVVYARKLTAPIAPELAFGALDEDGEVIIDDGTVAARLDSGDLLSLSKEVRRVLDEAGLDYVRIFVSGGLDEEAVDTLLGAGAPIDAFGIGTRMNVSADAPYFDMAYKIVAYAGRNVLKLSAGKTTWTGEKQIFRFRGRDGSVAGDVLALRDEPAPAGAEPLLRTVMRGGELVEPLPSLPVIRDYARAQIAALPDAIRRLSDAAVYEVRYSARLLSTQHALEAETHAAEVASVLADAGHADG